MSSRYLLKKSLRSYRFLILMVSLRGKWLILDLAVELHDPLQRPLLEQPTRN